MALNDVKANYDDKKALLRYLDRIANHIDCEYN